ncbi:hypothetical protein GA0116948_11827 [Chitinophaga costaii]|uniref:Uncharacterized protein n=1 Tax=Chitinophaga costaii TaxID=1335309 RepID=A0A1C4FXT5_9BACT|nr:hypothetical protein [Chitinophaga costaii]PUZ20903.1 hypothetical protein DCM91_17375 [Chitinophaga costaii]SCC60750.1 hypothetical protein GA0116948_11827 [Chitinophaga costaii]
MAKNHIDEVKHEIQELAIGNYKSYPEEYEKTPDEVNRSIESLAKGYWDSREDKEIARDERLGISLENYQEWTREAYTTFIAENAQSLN